MMNSIMREYWSFFQMYQALRNQMMDLLTDEDLVFNPGGANPPLGILCKEIGEVQQAYILSFTNRTLDFSYHNEDPAIPQSISKLVAWYEQLDDDLYTAVAGLSDEEIATQIVDRGGNFRLSLRAQLDIYKEALLIFYGKASVYLKALGKELPEQWRHWIA
jgi:hypothetical protein